MIDRTATFPRPAAPLALALLALCVAPAALAAERSVDERRTVDPRGSVEIVNVAGSVDVQAWDRPEVHVTGTLGERVERLEFTTEGTRTTIRVVLPKGGRGWGNGDGSADLAVRMPASSGLAASLVSADVKTRGVRGEQRLQTVSGEIDADLGREAQLRSVSGGVTATLGTPARGEGRLRVATVSGDVELKGFDGSVEVETVSGSARLQLGRLTRGEFESVSGDLNVAAALAADGRLEAQTVSGDLELRFEGTPPAEFEIESFSGDVRNCFGPKPTTERYGPGTRLSFREGAGTARVRADSKSGDIEICNR